MHRLRLATAEASPIEPYVADVVPIEPNTDLLQVGETAEDFARLFDRHAVTIHRYVARRLGRTEADDLLSQTFLIAFERRHRYVGTPAGALPWLYGIATNLIHRRRRDEVRQYRAYARSEPAGFDQHSDPLATEVAARVDAASVSRVLTGVLAGLRQVERDVPAPDPLVLARTRQRLLTPPPVRRRAARLRLLLAGGLALTLAGAFLAADVVRHDSSPLPGTVADASTFLADAATQAIAHPEAPIPPGQYRQVTTLHTYIYEFGPDHRFRATTLMQVDAWLPADSARPHVERVLSPVRVDFATPEAKVAARRLAPHLLERPKPSLYRVTCRGVTIEPNASPDALKAPCTPDWHRPTAEFLAKQPWDPDALLAKLRNEPLAKGPLTRLQQVREKATPPDQKAFNRISGALASGILPADLRAALYQAARKIPGIQLLGEVTTLDGRRGRAIGFVYNGYRQDIIISPTNGQSIGSRLVVADAPLLNGESNISGHLSPGDVYNATSVTTQITATRPPLK